MVVWVEEERGDDEQVRVVQLQFTVTDSVSS